MSLSIRRNSRRRTKKPIEQKQLVGEGFFIGLDFVTRISDIVDSVESFSVNPNILFKGDSVLVDYGDALKGRKRIKERCTCIGDCTNSFETGNWGETKRWQNLEESKNGKKSLVIYEIPFMVNKARTLEKIAELVKEKKLDGISEGGADPTNSDLANLGFTLNNSPSSGKATDIDKALKPVKVPISKILFILEILIIICNKWHWEIAIWILCLFGFFQ